MSIENNFSPLFKIARTANKISNTLTNSLKSYEIASEQRAILDIVNKVENITQNQISEILGKDKTTVSRSLDAIEKKGYITRTATKEDKRVKVVSLSKKGKSVLDETKVVLEDFRSSSLNGFSKKDMEVLSEYIDKIFENIEKNNNAK